LTARPFNWQQLERLGLFEAFVSQDEWSATLQTLTEDILSQYIARVQDEIGVSINEAAVRLAVGGQDRN
jgi:hypothetical protein